MTVADALRNSRVSAGLTQRQVAEMLGVTPQFMSDIEQGRRALGEKYLSKLPDGMRRIVATAMVSEHETAISRISDEIWQGRL
jgi:transcriptional regulator with XRE-family HTH domain